MARISFTPNLARHLPVSAAEVEGHTVGQVLSAYFDTNPGIRSYVLDDQGHLHHHVAVFVNSELIRDRKMLTDKVDENDEVFVMQALSGG